jgi:hypothetical protein
MFSDGPRTSYDCVTIVRTSGIEGVFLDSWKGSPLPAVLPIVLTSLEFQTYEMCPSEVAEEYVNERKRYRRSKFLFKCSGGIIHG